MYVTSRKQSSYLRRSIFFFFFFLFVFFLFVFCFVVFAKETKEDYIIFMLCKMFNVFYDFSTLKEIPSHCD